MERSKRKTDFLTEPGFFSLAVLVEIIRQTEDKGAAVPLSTVARKLGMSLSYAEKLAVILRREGLVKTVRGVRGGFAPAKAPQDIPAAAVVRAAYGHSILRESGTDSMRKVQKLRAHLHNLNYLYLDKITVADIIADQLDQNPHVGLLTAILREAPR
ncbi:MAG TPA: Rrf2 family transcriptional regulator, partial [Patescibacteria group bacterium]|nr:Rrf2 family transcriptional regulator [Patescibacteria group bacterium]